MTPTYDMVRMMDDVAACGWARIDVSRMAGLPRSRVYAFFTGQKQTARTAEAITRVLGKPPGFYLLRKSSKKRVAA